MRDDAVTTANHLPFSTVPYSRQLESSSAPPQELQPPQFLTYILRPYNSQWQTDNEVCIATARGLPVLLTGVPVSQSTVSTPSECKRFLIRTPRNSLRSTASSENQLSSSHHFQSSYPSGFYISILYMAQVKQGRAVPTHI